MMDAIVLNSGGYDSTILLHYVSEKFEKLGGGCIASLHFLYGAQNEEEQRNCVAHTIDVVNSMYSNTYVNKVLRIPRFDWTNGGFYDIGKKTKEECFLEWRNLVFLSYAISYAQSKGCKSIYAAFLYGSEYLDTNPLFVERMNTLIKETGIRIYTPFEDKDKNDLLPLAIKYKLRNTDYFSCDRPVDGKPCGECGDCKTLSMVNEKLTIDTPFKAYLYANKRVNDEVIDLMRKEPIHELRALINNDCQMNCDHCFYGFKKPKRTLLTDEEYYEKVIYPAVEVLHVDNVHFSGKEPLFNRELLFSILRRMEEDGLLKKTTFNLVTNGINLDDDTACRLKDYGITRVFLSVDSGGLRAENSIGASIVALTNCESSGIPVTLFYDLWNYCNSHEMKDTVKGLFDRYYNTIDELYVRTVRGIGKGDSTKKEIDIAEIEEAFGQLLALSWMYPDKNFTLSISIEYLDEVRRSRFYEKIIKYMDDNFVHRFRRNFSIVLERYCSRYESSITVTPDGYVLGCASEVAVEDYPLISAGNVRENHLEDLVNKAKMSTCGECNNCNNGAELTKCSFLYETS